MSHRRVRVADRRSEGATGLWVATGLGALDPTIGAGTGCFRRTDQLFRTQKRGHASALRKRDTDRSDPVCEPQGTETDQVSELSGVRCVACSIHRSQSKA